MGSQMYECQVCGSVDLQEVRNSDHGCPNCGSRMELMTYPWQEEIDCED